MIGTVALLAEDVFRNENENERRDDDECKEREPSVFYEVEVTRIPVDRKEPERERDASNADEHPEEFGESALEDRGHRHRRPLRYLP